MKKKVTPKKKRNRKPGLKSTDGMVKKRAKYERKNNPKTYIGINSEGTEFKMLNKGGVEKLFATPESLWQAACEYFQWVMDNPWVKKEWKAEYGLVDTPVGRPMTNIGMCTFWGVGADYYRHFKAELSKEDKERFGPVINLIDNTIYTQKFEGAAVGAFNANIISRDLGLADSANINVTDNRKEVADLFPWKDDEPKETEE